MKRVALLSVFLAAACAASASLAADALRCRVYFTDGAAGKSVGESFTIRGGTLADFASMPGHDYEIGKAGGAGIFAGARIALHSGDRVELASVADGLLLQHSRAGVVVGSSILQPDAWGFWAVGDAYDGSGARVGYYYAYRLPDAAVCRHSDPDLLPDGSPAPCRRVRFEYFDEADRAVDDHHPQILRGHYAQNVFESDDPRCAVAAFGLKQTDEGDGDEGRRR
ncbi:hypothetical protein ACFJIW_22190 [Tahibacter sp. UC22_41]|uniref:hypothetical protein n=1 Tax=Tahibacter sp. UC22_41 TaxID=3350178 RepID=UPI0036D9D2BA